MEKTPTTFTCFAGCVTRDTFRFLNPEEIKPALSLGFANISAMNCDAAEITSEMLEIGANYEKKCILLDVNKTLFENINQADTEYFIFDVISERLPIMKFSYGRHNEKFGYATKVFAFIDNWYKMIKNNSLENLRKERDYFSNQLFDELDYESNIKDFCEKLLKKYPANKIVFNEVYLANSYIDEQKQCFDFNSENGYKIQLDYNKSSVSNPFLEKVVSVIKKYLPNINYIKTPRSNFSDSLHWFGLHPLHFNNNYYNYVADCIKVIVNEKDDKIKKEKLEILYEGQSRNNEIMLEILKKNSEDLQKLKNEKTLREKWQAYAFSFKHMIDENLVGGGYLSRELLKIGIRNIAIYGNTEITKVLVKELNDTDVQILYIVENESVEGIKTIPRSSTKFEDVDLMLVADVSNFKQIEEKLKKFGLKFKIASAYEFLMGLKN